MKRPLSCVNLNKAIIRLAGAGDSVRLSRTLADVIVGQILPNGGVVKGGSSLLFRYGSAITRYTRDVDAARGLNPETFRMQLEHALATGWNGFTGKLIAVHPPKPKDVPAPYVMIPYDVKLDYCGKPWQTVRLEVGHNELGDAEEYDEFLPSELGNAFEQLGFPRPKPIRVMKLSYQVAQKLHAVSEPGSERAHDLIDLQLIVARSNIDLVETHEKCIRLFAYRRRQSWPPVIISGNTWESTYEAAFETIKDKTALLNSAARAVDWANNLILRIEAAQPDPILSAPASS